MLKSVTQELSSVLPMTSAVIPRGRTVVLINPDSFSGHNCTDRMTARNLR